MADVSESPPRQMSRLKKKALKIRFKNSWLQLFSDLGHATAWLVEGCGKTLIHKELIQTNLIAMKNLIASRKMDSKSIKEAGREN